MIFICILLIILSFIWIMSKSSNQTDDFEDFGKAIMWFLTGKYI